MRHTRNARASVSIILAGLMALTATVPASAATVTNTWQARVGSAGVNGTAKLQAYAGGTGSIAIKLIRLKPSTSLAVVISKGTCSAVGSTLITLPSLKTTSTGAATRTSSLTAAQIKAVVAATKGTGKIAIRLGSGTSRKCGQFVLIGPVVVVPTVAATIPVGVYPQHVALDATGVWVTNAYDRTLSRIDPQTNTVLSVVQVVLPGNTVPEGITTGFGSIWVSLLTYDDAGTSFLAGSVLRIDPASGSVLGSPIPVGRGDLVISASPESIWVSNSTDGTVSRIDPLSNLVTATVSVGASPVGVTAGFGSIWVANEADGKVARIDPATNLVTTTIQTRENAEAVAVGAGSIWVANYGTVDQPNGTVSRIDPATNSVIAAVTVGNNPLFLAFGGGSVWVAMRGEARAIQIDAQTNTVKNRIDVGAKSWGIAASDHAVWIVHPTAAGADLNSALPGTVTRINF